MVNLYIVDSQKAVSLMLSESLTARGHHVQGVSDHFSDAVREIMERKPDLLILEMKLPGGSGAELIAKVREAQPKMRFLIFSDDRSSEGVKACLQAGAHGFVEKSVDLPMFLNAFKIVAGGGSFFGFEVTKVLRNAVKSGGETVARENRLTGREREVLILIAQGNSNKDIAAKLGLSIKTVDNHRCSMMRKLDLHNVAAITLYAVRHRLIAVDYVV